MDDLTELLRGIARDSVDWLDFLEDVDDELQRRGCTTIPTELQPELMRLTLQICVRRASRHERVITIRLPRVLHGALLLEADRRDTSLNCLAVAKLLHGVHLPDLTANHVLSAV